jgi:parallel beta-helix repeat protein
MVIGTKYGGYVNQFDAIVVLPQYHEYGRFVLPGVDLSHDTAFETWFELSSGHPIAADIWVYFSDPTTSAKAIQVDPDDCSAGICKFRADMSDSNNPNRPITGWMANVLGVSGNTVWPGFTSGSGTFRYYQNDVRVDWYKYTVFSVAEDSNCYYLKPDSNAVPSGATQAFYCNKPPTPACGVTLMTSATLNADIGPCSGDGLVIGRNGITLNCAGHTITGSDTGVGISLTRRTKVTVKNCNVKGFSEGFWLYYSNGSTLSKNVAYNDIIGFLFHHSSKNTLKWNTADRSSSSVGFAVEFASSYNRFTNNVAMNSNVGFQADTDSNYNVFTKNIAYNDGGGFEVLSSYNSLSSNSAPDCGFGLMNGGHNILVKNEANHASFFLQNSAYNTLSGNTANDSRGWGFGFILDGASNNKLVGNKATKNYHDGFLLYDHSINNILTRNTANNNGQNGFWLLDSSMDTLVENTANVNGFSGFNITRSNSIQLNRNSANSNTQYGYYDLSAGAGTKGTANTYTSNICKVNGQGGSMPSGLCTPQP